MSHRILQTGQQTCHGANGEALDCTDSRHDAFYSIGRLWPQPRFETQGPLVIDRATDLTWCRDAGIAEFPMTWQEALAWIAQQNEQALYGYRDWRLPNRRELRSLISHQTRRPALPDGHPFDGVFCGWYWTSTSAAISPSHAWYVDMDGGRMFYGGKDQSYMVWPVRGNPAPWLAATGQERCFDGVGSPLPCDGSGQDGERQIGARLPESRFTTAGDGVRDDLTGLIWYRDGDLTHGGVDWQSALDAVAALNDRARQDDAWRLPNINELESLVDCSRHSPALADGHGFANLGDTYWSATTSMYEPTWAWALYLNKGAVGVGEKTQARFRVWAVRSG
ncbi:MAG: DUF1566 domain-containing protein [Gammaproteobacteria bacterium]|nr:DUF1566 domain-containing protein [Gammaproteobacteria bacterium]